MHKRAHLPIMSSQSMPKRSVISTFWLAWLFRKDHQSLHSCWLLQNSFLDCPVSSVTSKPHTCREQWHKTLECLRPPQTCSSCKQRWQKMLSRFKGCSGLSWGSSQRMLCAAANLAISGRP